MYNSKIVDDFLAHFLDFLEKHKNSDLVKQLYKSIDNVDAVAFHQLSGKVARANMLENEYKSIGDILANYKSRMNNLLGYHKIKRGR